MLRLFSYYISSLVKYNYVHMIMHVLYICIYKISFIQYIHIYIFQIYMIYMYKYIEIHFKIKSTCKKKILTGLFMHVLYFCIPPFPLSQTRHLKVTALFIPPNCDIDTGWISF